MNKEIQKKLGAIDLTKQFEEMDRFKVSCSIVAVDEVIGGGFPASRLTELFGDFSSGKSRLAYHVLANTQRLGGYALLLDTERSFSPGLAGLTELDLETLIYPSPDEKLSTVEDVFGVIFEALGLLRDKDADRLITIVWDSVAASVTKEDLESDELSVSTSAMRRAKVIGDGLRKLLPEIYRHKAVLVFINQIRDRIGVMYGAPVDTVGGRMIKFAASLRLHCYVGKKLKDKEDNVTGFEGRLVVEKSKICRPFETVHFTMLMDKPIDQYSGLLELLVQRKEVEKLAGGWYQFVGKDRKFREADFAEIYEGEKAQVKL